MSKTKHLNEIATTQSGYSFRGRIVHSDNGNAGVVQAKDISRLYVDEGSITRVSLDLASDRFIQEGDVLLTARGSFRAGVAKFQKPAIASASLFLIRVTDKTILPEYLAIYLNSEGAQYYFSQNAKGATIQSVAVSDLQNITVPVIPLESQQVIVDLQRNIEAQRSLLNRKQDIINEVLKTSVTRTLQGVN